MTELSSLEFDKREKWRKWLEDNYDEEKEIWVIIQKKKSKKRGLRYNEAVEEALCFGWIDSKMKSIDSERFRQRFSPRKKNSIWSKNNKEKAEKMIDLGMMTDAGFRAINESKKSGKWDSAYTSRRKPIIPKDLMEALKGNRVAWDNFQKYSNSVKFQYVFWVNSAKRKETRARRIVEVVSKAAQNIKPQ